MKTRSRIFVVDADIARAAGPDPKDRPWPDTAKAAHDVLDALWRCRGFMVVFDPILRDEWREHAGRTADRWFARMLERRRIRRVSRATGAWLDPLIDAHLDPSEQRTARKDAHLVLLAHAPGDKRVLSNDRRAKRTFSRIPDRRVQAIHWVEASEDACRWLMDGAPDMPAWRLGHRRRSR